MFFISYNYNYIQVCGAHCANITGDLRVIG